MKVLLLLLVFFTYAFCQTSPTTGNCTRVQLFLCVNVTLPNLAVCASAQVPSFDPNTCCYTCNPKNSVPPVPPVTCNVDPDTIPVCASGQVPTRGQNGCPTCRPSNGIPVFGYCNASAIAACAQLIPKLPPCGVLQPEMTSDCCITCLPTPLPCTIATLRQCLVNYEALPICVAGQEAIFNISTCCRSCRRPIPTNQPDPISGKCTSTTMFGCLSASLDTCKPHETPFRNETTECCPSCRRPETLCAREDVVHCFRTIRACAVGETASYVPGQCCPTCYSPPPCTLPCAAGSICVVREDGPICLKTVSITLVAKFTNGTVITAGFTVADVKILIREIVQRYCEKNENTKVCSNIADTIEDLDAILQNAAVSVHADGSVTIVFPDLPNPTVIAVVTASVSDSYSTGPSYSFSVVNSPTATGNSATLAVSVLLMFILAFIM